MSIKIGVIEFRSEAVHIAIVKAGGRLPKLLDHATAPIVHPDDDSELDGLTAALDAALSQLKSAPSVWMLAVASANSIVRQVKIPFKGKRKVDAALTFELEPNLAIPIEELLIDYQIIQENRKFSEKKLTIKAGDTITFVNNDKVSHNVYSKSKMNSFDIGVQRSGDSYTVTFVKFGKVKVRCAIHPKMKLTVYVQ